MLTVSTRRYRKMPSAQLATVFAVCCCLHFSYIVGLTFTSSPPSTLYARLGSNATFRWEFKFDTQYEGKNVKQVIWSKQTRYGSIRAKYITVTPAGIWIKNPDQNQVPRTTASRIHWSGNFSKNGSLQVFTLSNVSKSDDTFYGCEVEMINGDEFKDGPKKLNFATIPTFVNRPNATKDVDEGDDVTVQCDATGVPVPTVSWKKDGTMLPRYDATSTLVISNVKRRNGGTYTCIATNQAGSVSHSVLLKVVRYGPHINKTASSSPVIKSWVNQLTALKCAFDSNPLANITWFKDGRSVHDNVSSMHDLSTLTLAPKDASDFGFYSCNASNSKGTASYLISVQQLYPPGPPVIDHVSRNVLEFNVSWNATSDNGGSAILDFMITLLHTNGSEVLQKNGINGASFTFQNLQQNRTYICMLQARNKVGYGRSVNITVTTLQAEEPGPPVDIRALQGVLSLNVTWRSSIKDKVRVLDYRIKVIDSNTLNQVQIYTSIKRTSWVIKNLKKNSSYIVVIQARNEVGYGETANISTATLPEGPPDSPLIMRLIARGECCFLQWKKPYNGESSIATYTVYVWLVRPTTAANITEKFTTLNTTKTSSNLTLDWDQTYAVEVSAWNKYGESSHSFEGRCTTGKSPQVTKATLAESTATGSTLVSSVSEEPGDVSTTAEGKWKITFDYIILLWIVILAVAVPATVFALWKATQKIRRRKYLRKTNHEKDNELGNANSVSTVEELKDMPVNTASTPTKQQPRGSPRGQKKKVLNQYETITEVLEVHYNHGYCSEDLKNSDSGGPVTHHYYVPGDNSQYNHLYETPGSPGSKNLKNKKKSSLSDKQRQENGEYSHLSRGESLDKEFKCPPLPDTRLVVPPRRQWEISGDRLRIENTIGRGEFGLVKKGYALDVTSNGGWSVVAVKTLKGDAKESHRKDLLSELKVMKELSPHKHVVQLLACVTKSKALCVITEFAPYGDLLGFLRKKRGFKDDYYNTEQLPKIRLTSRQLMAFAWQIADGMAHLSSAKIVHRDLAARNVLLGENLTCKVTDFGMARDIQGKNMYQKTSEGRLPVKWTAIESLEHGQYTTKSDVWSFGVVLFEIVTVGGRPYPGMDAKELVEKLRGGYRMAKPQHLDEKVYTLMRSCWNEDPSKRLTFGQLYRALKQLNEDIPECINLTTYDGGVYENL